MSRSSLQIGRGFGAVAATLTILAMAGPAGSATANVYTVRACDAADGANQSWAVMAARSKRLVAFSLCPSGGKPARGLGAHNVPARRGRPHAVRRGTRAGLLFAAPPGTSIVGITAAYSFYRHGGGWRTGLWTNRGILVGCGRGRPNCRRSAINRYVATAPAAALYVGIACAARSCSTATRRGADRFRAAASLYSARVVIRDDSRPHLGSVTGPLWASGWHAGTQTVSFAASDNTGVAAAALLVDGKRVGAVRRTCVFTNAVPCPQGGETLPVDTSVIRPDGPHTITVQVTDAANNTTQISRSVLVDNTAPAQPAQVVLDGGPDWRRTNAFSVGWQNPPDDGGSPIAGAYYELCPASGARPCIDDRHDGEGIDSLTGVQVPTAGDWLLRIWLRDAAGNTDRRTASTPVELRWDDEAPQAAFLPQDPNDPTRIAVQASDRISGVASGVIEVKPSNGTAWQPLQTAVDSNGLVARLDDAKFPDGVYELRARAVDRAGNETSTATRTDGKPETLTLPLRLKMTLRAGAVRTTGNRRRKVLRRVAHVAFGHRAHLTGRLTSADGTPMANAAILVQQRLQGTRRDWTPVASVTTSRHGRFRYTTERGPSRDIRFFFAGSPTIRSATRDVAVRVAASTTFHVNRHSVRNGRSVRFYGRVRGGRIPQGGKLLELQVLLRHKWRTFTTLHTDQHGRWRYRYRFAATHGRVLYKFRAHVPREATYPYASAASRRAKVIVRG